MSSFSLILCREHQQHPIADGIPNELWLAVFSYLRPWHDHRIPYFRSIESVKILEPASMTRPLYFYTQGTLRTSQSLEPALRGVKRDRPGKKVQQLRISPFTIETGLWVSSDGLAVGPRLVLMARQIWMAEFRPVIRARGLKFEVDDLTTGRGIYIRGQCGGNGWNVELDSPECDALVGKYRLQSFMDNIRSTPYDRIWVIEYNSQLKTSQT
jgi:hypothetical protein